MRLQCLDLRVSNKNGSWFVCDTKHGHDTTIFGLRDELGNDTDVVQGALSVCQTHGSHKHVDIAKLAGVIPAVLGTGKSMIVEIDTETVLSRPLDCLEEVTVHKSKEMICFKE